jgi:hypothetical protein
MKKIIIMVVALTALVFTACKSAPTCQPHNQPTPAIYEATFVESSSTAESMIKASGTGCTVDEALNEAKKTAIWFVLEAGDKPLLKTPAEKTRAVGLAQQMYATPDKFIRWTSDLKSKQTVGGKLKVAYIFKIDVAMISEQLEANGIITSSSEIAENIGLPTLAVFADKGGDWGRTAVTVMQEYFQDNSFEVYASAQQSQTNDLVSKISKLEGAETDPMHDMALSLGSDIYAKLNYSGGGNQVGGTATAKASITVEVFETASAKMLASTTGYSAERRVTDVNALIQEATNDAATKVLSQIKKEWMKMAETGKPFKITVLSNSEEGARVDETVYGLLRKMSKRPIKRQGGGKSTFSYIVYVKDVPNAYELFLNLRDAYDGPGQLEKVSDTGSFLVFKAASDGEIELEIE